MVCRDARSEYRYYDYGSVDRNWLAVSVLNKLPKDFASFSDVAAVISILFEEMTKDLFFSKKIEVKNFGIFNSIIFKPKKLFNVFTKEFFITPETQKFQFFIDKKLSKFIINNLDLAKTFHDVYLDQ